MEGVVALVDLISQNRLPREAKRALHDDMKLGAMHGTRGEMQTIVGDCIHELINDTKEWLLFGSHRMREAASWRASQYEFRIEEQKSWNGVLT